jgi:hypothetical protein
MFIPNNWFCQLSFFISNNFIIPNNTMALRHVQVEKVVRAALSRHGGLDGVVSCIGNVAAASALATEVQQLQQDLQVCAHKQQLFLVVLGPRFKLCTQQCWAGAGCSHSICKAVCRSLAPTLLAELFRMWSAAGCKTGSVGCGQLGCLRPHVLKRTLAGIYTALGVV